MYRYLIFLLAFMALLGCGKDNQAVDPVDEGKKVDKTSFVASLVAGYKYWRFEELAVEQSSSIRKFNLMSDSTKTLPDVATEVITRHTACRFLLDGKLSPDEVSGPYGSIPYTPKVDLRVYLPSYSYPGSWFWDEKRETVAINGMSGARLMVSAISKTKSSPEICYVDNTMPAKYRTLNQAVQGKSPDRIRIIFYEEDPEIGTVKYIFTMRAAWITKMIDHYGNTEIYEALY